MKTVFISYARGDSSFVERVSHDLRTGGVRTWRDVEEIQAGENWQDAISGALFNADVLLYVASARSTESSWVKHELEGYLKQGGRVIPVILDDQGEAELPDVLRQYQWVDFRHDYDSALQVLLAALQPVREDRAVADEPKRSKGYVFLSYAEEDAEFVDSVKRFMAERGYAYWDYRESKRRYQDDLYLELEGVITAAAGTLSILSPEWKRSRTALKELHFSNEVGTPVFLLRIREMPPTLAIAGTPYIDFTYDEKKGFEELDRELRDQGL